MLYKRTDNNTTYFVINSPSNPTGAVYSKAELQALATVLKKHPQILITITGMASAKITISG
jgi:aspartate aminotransferase